MNEAKGDAVSLPLTMTGGVMIEEENTPAFHAAFGEMVLRYADMEHSLFNVLVYYAELTEVMGRILFAGEKQSFLIKHLRNIVEYGGISEERKADLLDLFKQLGHITTLRSMLVHHGSAYDYEWIEPSRARSINKLGTGGEVVRHVNASILKAMASDLIVVCNRLNEHTNLGAKPFQPWIDPTGKQATWLYRLPPIQETSGGPTQSGP